VAGTIYVPQDYNTIQSAIDASKDGDTIILAPGTYTGDGNRDLDFGGRAITLSGIDPYDSNVVCDTIIDCNGSPNEPHRGFRFDNGEGSDSVIAGLTIVNGYAGDGRHGGGILNSASLNNSSFTVAYCRFINNSAEWGGAILNGTAVPSGI
jgi:hypothetical protein